MKNPGLDPFLAAATFVHPQSHPIFDDIRPGDPDYDPEHEENPSDYVPPNDFSRVLNNPGQPRIPAEVTGPRFKQDPEDVIHAEVISPEEEEAASRIYKGEHESDQPSDNPYVEHARQDLHTPESQETVHTVANLFNGGHVSPQSQALAHSYLRGHFSEFKVNADHGTIVASSPSGSQMIKRHPGKPLAIGGTSPTTYSSITKHGVTEDEDFEKTLRTALALQMLHNEYALEKKKKDEEDKKKKHDLTLMAAYSNDLCPVCASGYLEPYSGEHHECLNCGSLVSKTAAFVKSAMRPRPKGKAGLGLGRGLGQIIQDDSNAVGISQSPEDVAAAVTVIPDGQSGVHPLKDATNENPDAVYDAPTELREKGQVRRTATEADPIDVHMGKQGWKALHGPGEPRTYLTELPGVDSAYARLQEDTKGGRWTLTSHLIPKKREWQRNRGPNKGATIPMRGMRYDTIKPGSPAELGEDKQVFPVPDLGERQMAEDSVLASGSHPIDDPRLAWAIGDIKENGRRSKVFTGPTLNTAFEPKPPVAPTPRATQRDLRGLSSVENPGLARFNRATD